MKKHEMRHNMYHFFGVKAFHLPGWASPLALVWLIKLCSLFFGWISWRLIVLADPSDKTAHTLLIALAIVAFITTMCGLGIALAGYPWVMDEYKKERSRDQHR